MFDIEKLRNFLTFLGKNWFPILVGFILGVGSIFGAYGVLCKFNIISEIRPATGFSQEIEYVAGKSATKVPVNEEGSVEMIAEHRKFTVVADNVVVGEQKATFRIIDNDRAEQKFDVLMHTSKEFYLYGKKYDLYLEGLIDWKLEPDQAFITIAKAD